MLLEAQYLARLEIGEIYKTDLLHNLFETRWPKFAFEEGNIKFLPKTFLT